MWEEPADFKPKFKVVSCFVQFEDRFLLLLRNADKSEGNKWGVPGGKIDEGETPVQAVKREIAEETGIDLPEDSFVFYKTAYVRYPDYDFVFTMYSTKLEHEPKLVVSLSEHQEARWMTPEEALAGPLVMGNEELYRGFFGL